MSDLEKISGEYYEILNQQDFDAAALDYTLFDKTKQSLKLLAQIKNSGISVFDLYKKSHIYNSYNLSNLFGYHVEQIDTAYYNSRIHPDDLVALMEVGIIALKQFYTIPVAEKKDYKLQNEYRIWTAEEKHVRIIEQFQVLELDKDGNLWLALSILDISPNQEEYQGIRSQMINVKTGAFELISPKSQSTSPNLSKRELEVIAYVKDGLLSKEISDKLSISIHTVNTHRQNILKKLGANSSIEALHFVAQHNLI